MLGVFYAMTIGKLDRVLGFSPRRASEVVQQRSWSILVANGDKTPVLMTSVF